MHLIKDNISFTVGKLVGDGGWVGVGGLAGSMVSLWKYPKCPPNGDEEMEQKHKRRQCQVKKYSTCTESVLRGTGEEKG